MNITVIGAGGSIGREVAHLIVEERLLDCDQRLKLVGNSQGESAKSLYGLAVDLMDAYAEVTPAIDVALSPETIEGDLIIMAGGATIPTTHQTGPISRDFLAENNAPIFERYASALAKHGHGNEIVVCISNPNELAVAIFAKHLGRKRVIGMGAFLDSLRFRKEIALDLGIRRQRIHGFIIGEHGPNLVPLWSSVHIYGMQKEALNRALAHIRKGHTTAHFREDVMAAMEKLKALVTEGEVRSAYALIDQYPPDIRVALKPFITHFSGAKTTLGTAKATLELIRIIMLGHDALISGQISLEGEYYGIHTALGAPCVIGNQGVDRIITLELDPDEKQLLLQGAENIQQKLAPYC